MSPVSIAWRLADTHEPTNLAATLVRAGGRVLARQEHGLFLAIRRHLVFVPTTLWVSEAVLADALHAARLTPERFLELRAAASS